MSSHQLFLRTSLALAMAMFAACQCRHAFAQALLREAPEAEAERRDEPPPAKQPRGGRLTAEEEQQLRVQQLMEFQRDQMFKDAEQKASSERMMRYALWVAITVIALTLLIAYSRNRTETPAAPTPGAGQGRGAPPIEPTSQEPIDKPSSGELNGN
ncbi:MAG TPA: hypothetical protein VFW87_03510 [Pirellulales bacterium]|nr:hypothetical protein [Pirellulales bacterium]